MFPAVNPPESIKRKVSIGPSLWRKMMHLMIEEFYNKADVVPYALLHTLPERFVGRAVIADIK